MKRIGVGGRLRFEVLKRDRFRCRYCGATAAEFQLVIDHVVPVARGGSNGIDNLATACTRCNAGKWAVDLAAVDDGDVVMPAHECAVDIIKFVGGMASYRENEASEAVTRAKAIRDEIDGGWRTREAGWWHEQAVLLLSKAEEAIDRGHRTYPGQALDTEWWEAADALVEFATGLLYATEAESLFKDVLGDMENP